MTDASLNDDMWEAARLIWENTPKITDADLMDQLSVKFGDEVPKSNGTISKRRKKEGWEKNDFVAATKRVAKRTQDGGKTKKPRKKSTEKSGNFPPKTNKVGKTEKSPSLEEKKSAIESVIDDVVLNAKGRAKIIQKYRKRYIRAGEVFDDALDVTLGIRDLADAVEEAQNELLRLTHGCNADYGADFEIGENGESAEKDIEAAQAKVDLAMNMFQKSMVLSKTLTDTATNLAAGLKSLSEVDMPLCGITPDDFRESDQSRRLGALAKLGDIHEKEKQARDSLLPGLHERLRKIEATAASEDFGRSSARDDDQENIEDIDYTAID